MSVLQREGFVYIERGFGPEELVFSIVDFNEDSLRIESNI